MSTTSLTAEQEKVIDALARRTGGVVVLPFAGEDTAPVLAHGLSRLLDGDWVLASGNWWVVPADPQRLRVANHAESVDAERQWRTRVLLGEAGLLPDDEAYWLRTGRAQ